MAEEAQTEATQNQGGMQQKETVQVSKPPLRMPGLDIAGIGRFLKGQQQQSQTLTESELVQPTTTQPQQGQPSQPEQGGESTDVVAAQEEYKNIKDGDTYTDDRGQTWTWSVVDFNVVPEKVKDEMVDSLDPEDSVGEIEEEDETEETEEETEE